MIYLSGGDVHPNGYRHERLGLMCQPGSYSGHGIIGGYPMWAADNGCFSERRPFKIGRWLAWLEALVALQGTCLFAVLPDAYGDAEGTLMRARGCMLPALDLGFKLAYVAQPGFHSTVKHVPWEHIDALFVGGPNEWKHCELAWRLPGWAHERELWAHMGRVNSAKRMAQCRAAGFDSADGTILALNPSAWPKVQGWLDEPQTQLLLR